jgi:hypothetical protein
MKEKTPTLLQNQKNCIQRTTPKQCSTFAFAPTHFNQTINYRLLRLFKWLYYKKANQDIHSGVLQ